MLLRGLTLATAALALLPAAALAQTRERVKVTNVRLGLPIGPFSNDSNVGGVRRIYKPGQWAPVYMDLECVRDTKEGLVIWVETTDADGAVSEASIETGPMNEGDRRTAVELGRAAYLKPGSRSATVAVRVKGAESGRTIGPEVRSPYGSSIDGPSFVLLSIGSSLNTVRFPAGNVAGADAPAARTLRGGWLETAQYLELGLLPDQWFGYGAADVIVLGTGADRQFWEYFAAPQHKKRREALVEWVRRGGRLIVSVGANADVLDTLTEIKAILPATVAPAGKRNVGRLPFTWTPQAVSSQKTGAVQVRGAKAEFAVVTPEPRADRATHTILVEGDPGSKQPLAVQGPHGLGRVTIVGFDLDRPPFSDWSDRAAFYETLFSTAGYQLPLINSKYEDATRFNSAVNAPRMDDYVASLQGSLDFFEGVPVVSFGWVALFILIYIVLIGPVDYLFLKKVVKRLEWTWVTFPVIVVSVSAGAYFAAYALKGRDLKINKVDVVDIDLAGRRVDGQTWFTLFSPRIHNYTLGVEPAGADPDGGPAWTAGKPESARDTLLSWHGAIDRNNFGDSGGFFDKRYRYQSIADPGDPNRDLYAAGMEGVPIQVWTTKAFTGRYTAPLDPARPPVTADLSVTMGFENTLDGTITSHLPVTDAPTDVALVWRGHVLPLADFPTGVEKGVNLPTTVGGKVELFGQWLKDTEKRYAGARMTVAKLPGSSGPGNPGSTEQPVFRLWPLLFYEAADENNVRAGLARNSSLRSLDQSWRVAPDRPEQAVLVLRFETKEKPAEEATRDPANPSRLWIGALPTVANPGSRPDVQGTLKQETYVRVFIPVKPARK